MFLGDHHSAGSTSINKLLETIIVILSCFFIVSVANAQLGTVKVHLHSPPPFQMNIEMLWHVDLTNSGGPRLVYLFGVARETKSGRWIADGTSNKFTIPNGITSVNPADIGPINYTADAQYDELVGRTGKVPAGDYTICMYVLDANKNDTLGKDCISNHVILNITCSHLIHPANNKSIIEKLPAFIWTPISPTVPVAEVSYNLKIVELLGRQTPFDAMQSNPTWFDVDDLPTPLCPYPLSAENLEAGKSYAWQITALAQSANGDRIELCKSEVWSFTVTLSKSDTAIVQPTDTVSPDLSHTDSSNKSNVISDKGEDTASVSLHVHRPPPIAEVENINPNTDVCKTLKVELLKISEESSYKLQITNKYAGELANKKPASFRITVKGDSIKFISGSVTDVWKRTPSKFPPSSSGAKWVSKSGVITNEKSNLGNITFRNPASTPVTVVYEWLNKDDELLCKDSTTLNESAAYYELSDEPSDVFIEVPNDVLHVEYLNNYSTSNEVTISILDAASHENIKSKGSKFGLTNMNGSNRFAIPLKGYKLTPGKSYILTLVDSKNSYSLNFNVSKDAATNDREK